MRYTIYAIAYRSTGVVVYIGSTSLHLLERQICHETRNINKKTIHNYVEENGGWDLFGFVKLGEFKCENDKECDKEKRIKEKEFIEEYKPICNINRAYRTPEELKEDYKKNFKNFKEKNPDYFKEYYEKTFEHRQELRKEYMKKNEEYYKQYREKNKKRKKEWSDNYSKQKVTCECGQEYTKNGKWRHINKAPRHLYYLQTGIKVDNIDELKLSKINVIKMN